MVAEKLIGGGHFPSLAFFFLPSLLYLADDLKESLINKAVFPLCFFRQHFVFDFSLGESIRTTIYMTNKGKCYREKSTDQNDILYMCLNPLFC